MTLEARHIKFTNEKSASTLTGKLGWIRRTKQTTPIKINMLDVLPSLFPVQIYDNPISRGTKQAKIIVTINTTCFSKC